MQWWTKGLAIFTTVACGPFVPMSGTNETDGSSGMETSSDGGATTENGEVTTGVTVPPECEWVEIVDPALDEEQLAKRFGHSSPFTGEEMAEIREIYVEESGVRSLQGLECAVGLQRLVLTRNEIEDVSPLAGLPNLRSLELDENQITDVGPLGTLPALENLNLRINQITDVSPLAEAPKLGRVNLTGNPVGDLSSLAALVSLNTLVAVDTGITSLEGLRGSSLVSLYVSVNPMLTDVSPVVDMPDLLILEIGRTGVTDLSPLLEVDWEPCASVLGVTEASLDAYSLEVVIPVLCERKVHVTWDEGECDHELDPMYQPCIA